MYTSFKKIISKKTMVSRLYFLRVVRESDAQSNQMSRHKMSPMILAPQAIFFIILQPAFYYMFLHISGLRPRAVAYQGLAQQMLIFITFPFSKHVPFHSGLRIQPYAMILKWRGMRWSAPRHCGGERL